MQYEPGHKEESRQVAHKNKKLTREDFKKDVTDAVKKGIATGKQKSTKAGKGGGKKKTGKTSYDSMKVSELRSFLNGKKTALLTKSGFPEGKLPRSKADMIALCKKLKRKRW